VKRTALICLTAIYLLSGIGLGINRVYCCGKLASVTLTYGGADDSSKQSAKQEGCCKNEKQNFKVKDSHFTVVSLALNCPLPAIISSFTSFNDENLISCLKTKIVYKGNAPPGHPDIPVYSLNCTYRI
jgi:hypothetical protein